MALDDNNSKESKKKEDAIRLLTERASALGRLPKKTDFDNLKIISIKNVLGPWPRALEIAGLKPVSEKTGQRRRKRK